MSRFDTLHDWLHWQESLHPSAIDLGLERVNAVYRRLLPDGLGGAGRSCLVVTIAGTNGKGTCVSTLEQLFLTAGYRVGSYSSPHLLRYNERIRLDGLDIDDAALIRAFEQVDRARGEQTLTYFEFGTLAALLVFADWAPQLVLLEVGMGGRLDATNIVDPDVSVIMSIGLDHQAWLGDTREQIALEKAGIMRAGVPAVCADLQPPRSLLEHAASIAAPLYRVRRDFDFDRDNSTWRWRSATVVHDKLPLPQPAAEVHLANAAAALQVAELLKPRLPYGREAIEQALHRCALPGRCQLWRQRPEVWLDVAHNPDAFAVLADHLRGLQRRFTVLVLGVMADKAVVDMLPSLAPQVQVVHVCAPACERAMPVSRLHDVAQRVAGAHQVFVYPSVIAAFAAAIERAGAEGRIVVAGSFYTVAEVMAGDGGKRL